MLANGVKETTTTTGTGTVTLSAVLGFPRFSQVLSVGQFVDYAIQDGNNWEWGVGKVAASNTLERTLITAKFDGGTYSKNPATRLSLSGGATVFCTVHDQSKIAALGITEPRGDYAALSGGMLVAFAPLVPGTGAINNAFVDTNRMSLWPVAIQRTVVAIRSRHVAGPTPTARPCLYRGDGPDGRPGTLVAFGTGVSLSFRAMFQSSFTGGAVTAYPGDWIGWQTNGEAFLSGEQALVGASSTITDAEPPRPAAGLLFSAPYVSDPPSTCPTTILSVLNDRAALMGVL